MGEPQPCVAVRLESTRYTLFSIYWYCKYARNSDLNRYSASAHLMSISVPSANSAPTVISAAT